MGGSGWEEQVFNAAIANDAKGRGQLEGTVRTQTFLLPECTIGVFGRRIFAATAATLLRRLRLLLLLLLPYTPCVM